MKRTVLLAVAGAGLFAGCAAPPEAVVAQFHRALAAGDGEKALKLLSERTRSELKRRAEEAHRASGGAISKDPAAMIVQGDADMYPSPGPDGKPRQVETTRVSMERDRARVRVVIAGEPHELELVRERGGWKIELPLTAPKP